MKPIYNNFDGLDISFQGALPEYILKQLRKAKEQAQIERANVIIDLNSGFPVSVAETGAKGGYQFRFDTGVDGETWFIADSDNMNLWNIRVSVKSLNLALRGYKGTKEKVLDILYNKLNAAILKERVSRFDYCVDFQSGDFELIPKNIISHNKSKRKFNLISAKDFEISGTARNIESVRIGTMPNRQLVIYNKLKEIISSKKDYWWDLWNINKEEFKGQIWRVEIRAGKKELNSWNIRKFSDLEIKAGDVILDILNSIRYVIPNENDNNSSRWHNEPFWNELINVIKRDLFDYISQAKREEIIEGIRKEKIEEAQKRLTGGLRGYSALTGKHISQLPEVIEEISGIATENLSKNKKKEMQKYEKSKNKYKMLS